MEGARSGAGLTQPEPPVRPAWWWERGSGRRGATLSSLSLRLSACLVSLRRSPTGMTCPPPPPPPQAPLPRSPFPASKEGGMSASSDPPASSSESLRLARFFKLPPSLSSSDASCETGSDSGSRLQ
eukprot:3713011-Rhodomonas_salina.3